VTVVQKGLQFLELEANLGDGDGAGGGEGDGVDGEYAPLEPRDILTKDVDELRRMVIEQRAAGGGGGGGKGGGGGGGGGAGGGGGKGGGGGGAAGGAAGGAGGGLAADGKPGGGDGGAGAGAAGGGAGATTTSGQQQQQQQRKRPAETAPAAAAAAAGASPGSAGRKGPLKARVAAGNGNGVAPMDADEPPAPAPPPPRGAAAAAAMPPPAARPVKAEGAAAAAAADASPSISLTRCATLTGHTSEVFICSWAPGPSSTDAAAPAAPLLLASGSGDGTARIWEVPPPPADGSPRPGNGEARVGPPRVLRHAPLGGGGGANGSDGGAAATANNNGGAGAGGAKTSSPQPAGNGGNPARPGSGGPQQCDVTTLDWHPAGSLLATGSYDGCARVWTREGNLERTLRGHGGPIFSLRWSRGGKLLLSGGVDKTAAVWDLEAAARAADPSSPDAGLVRRWAHHKGSTLDVDWRDDATFATCSSDATVAVCRVPASSAAGAGGASSSAIAAPLLHFAAHADEVNAVRWDPSGRLLASCSDDATAKVWAFDSEEADARAEALDEAEAAGDGAKAADDATPPPPARKPLHDLTGHAKEIYTLRWGPASGASASPLRLATASFDATVKLWDGETGRCLRTLGPHGDAVYALAFSPDGKMLATGSFDKGVRVWSAEDGALLREHSADGGVFELSWAPQGGLMVAASTNAHTVAVVDVMRR
jgi:transducin (beta)-like 1